MNRRQLLQSSLALASGLIVPWEPKRVYSFPSPDFLYVGKRIRLPASYGPNMYAVLRRLLHNGDWVAELSHLYVDYMTTEVRIP
jgi:hypothetical protein